MGEPHASIGTTAWISAPVPRKKSDLLRMQASVPGLDNASYLLANNQESAGRNLQWWRDAVAPDARLRRPAGGGGGHASGGRRGGVHARGSPASGRRSTTATRAPASTAIGGGATRGDLTRAVLEGVALNATWLLGAAEKFVGSRLDDIRLVGGGARSDLWCQILADTSDRSIVRVTDPWLAGLRGASLFAALTLGAVDRGEVRELVPTDEPFRPDPRRRETYDALVRELPKLYASQKGFFRRTSARG